MIKRLTIAALLVAPLLVATPDTGHAANQQVSPDTYRKAGNAPFYGRDDGLFYHKTYKSPRLVGNGDGYFPLGPTFFEDFSYGDGLGILCEASSMLTGTSGFSLGASANQACNTTCGNNGCVIGFANAGDLVACTDATADSCVCQTTSIDPILAGCGTNHESPALGVTLMTFASGVKLAQVSLLAQDIGPDMDADGLDIAGDQTDNDGNEILSGLYGASGRPLVPGVDPAFKFCVEANIEDLSGTDEFWVGFRDLTAPNATFNSYNSYAVVGVDNTLGDIHTETEDDGAGTTTTDITVSAWIESEPTEFCVLVSDAGVVTYTVAGESASDAVAYTLDNGEPVIPFVHFLHGTDVADEILLTKWEVSYQ